MKANATNLIRQAARTDAVRPVLLFATLLAACAPAAAQGFGPLEPEAKLIVESAAVSRVVEVVRAGSQGVIEEVFVKTGDIVRQGQLLGRTDLDATKLQLDLAQAALDATGNVEAAEGQAEAWTVTRKETEEAVRKRKVDKTRLAWATGMEKMYRGTHQIQLDAEKTQRIQYMYWKDQYDKRFFRSPVDGVVAEVLVEPGKSVTVAAHAFTIRNDNLLSVPVTVPEEIARTAPTGQTLPVRPSLQKTPARAMVCGVTDCPGRPGQKTLRLLIPIGSFPAAIRSTLVGTKFEVLFALGPKEHDIQAPAAPQPLPSAVGA